MGLAKITHTHTHTYVPGIYSLAVFKSCIINTGTSKLRLQVLVIHYVQMYVTLKPSHCV